MPLIISPTLPGFPAGTSAPPTAPTTGSGPGHADGKSSKGSKDKDSKDKDGLAREMEKLMEEKRKRDERGEMAVRMVVVKTMAGLPKEWGRR